MKKYIFALALLMSLTTLAACGNPSNDPVVPKGKVLLTEFGDLQCPSCKATQPLVKKLEEKFGDKLILRFVHFPLEQIHENAFHAAEAAECARDEGEEKFYKFIDETYTNQSSLNDETYKKTAKDVGLDEAKFAQCLTSGSKALTVRKDMKEGLNRGVNATPTFFLNGEKLESRKYEVIVKKIEELLGQPAPISNATPAPDATPDQLSTPEMQVYPEPGSGANL